MNLRDPHEHTPRPLTDDPGDDEPSGGDALRTEASSLLAAADRAIDRALSHNSAEFLLQTRQMGGQ
jgi:hypothetical protein